MGYLIASIAAAILLISILIALGMRRRGDGGLDKEPTSERHGLTREEPHDEGATLPNALENRKRDESQSS